MLISLSVSAAGASALFPFETFEGYDSKVGLEWTSQGAADYTDIIATEKNNSAKLVSTTSKMQELIKNFDKTSDSVKSIFVGFSINLQDLNAKRTLILKTSTLDANIIDIKNDGIIYVSDVTTGIALQTKKWYDISVEYSMLTGFVRLKVFDGVNTYTSEGFNRYKEQTAVTRVDFASWKATGSDAVCYIDNCFAYSLSYDVSYYASPVYVQDFESYTPSSDGLSAPSGWRLAGTDSLTSTSCASGADGGKSLDLYNGGTANFEAFYAPEAGIKSDATIEFDFKWITGSTIYFDVRGTNKTNASVSDNYIGYFTYRDEVKVYKEKGGAATTITTSENMLSADTWYHATIKLDLVNQTFSIKLQSGNNEINGEGIISKEVTTFKELGFFLKPGDGRTSRILIDNISVYQSKKTAVAPFTPAFAKIPASENTVYLDIVGNFTQDNLSSASVLVNGSQDGVLKTKEGNRIAITFDSQNYNSLYFVELKNLVCEDGTVLNAATAYQTGNKWTISDFEFTKSALSSGEIGTSLKFVSECDEISDATLILALYNSKTGAMIAASCDSTAVVKNTEHNLSCAVDVPVSSDGYELVAYIWDSFNDMKILGKSKILK